MPKKIKIIMDHREGRSGMYKVLQSFDDISLSIEHLPLGDYKVNDSILFERKTFRDFAVSIKDGRLFSQACKLAVAPQRGVIVLEGVSQDLAKIGVKREAMQGALITLSLYLGIPLLRAKDCYETVQLMRYTALQGCDFATGALLRKAMPRKGIRPKGKRRTQLYILQGLPGIGPVRAKHLLERFGSVESVFSAHQDCIANVDGIGKNTARKIRWAISEKPPPNYELSKRSQIH